MRRRMWSRWACARGFLALQARQYDYETPRCLAARSRSLCTKQSTPPRPPDLAADLSFSPPPLRLRRKQDFKSAATGVSAKAMRNELNAMIQGIDDPDFKKVRSLTVLPPFLLESLELRY